MEYLRVAVVLALVALAAHFWNGHKAQANLAASTDETGFVQAVDVDGAVRNNVLILAPPNCPSEEAQHAAALERKLTEMGIPHTMGSGFSVSIDNPDEEQRAGIDRAVAVFQQGAPAVFINGMAKSNPTAEEVATEYKRTKGKG